MQDHLKLFKSCSNCLSNTIPNVSYFGVSRNPFLKWSVLQKEKENWPNFLAAVNNSMFLRLFKQETRSGRERGSFTLPRHRETETKQYRFLQRGIYHWKTSSWNNELKTQPVHDIKIKIKDPYDMLFGRSFNVLPTYIQGKFKMFFDNPTKQKWTRRLFLNLFVKAVTMFSLLDDWEPLSDTDRVEFFFYKN